MRAIVTIHHPAHVHFFKHAITELEAAGHEVFVFAWENEMAVSLLEYYDIDHRVLAGSAHSLGERAIRQARFEAKLYRAARRIDPDVLAAVGGVSVAHVGALVGARSVAFTDTEHATIINKLTWPLADVVCTPAYFNTEIGEKQRRYPGFHELAYLHPDRFTPDSGVFDRLDLDSDEKLVVMRVSSWDSSHDLGQSGFADLQDAVERLEAVGARVLITSEVELQPSLDDRQLSVAPHRIHDLLAHADLFVGEGATMAAESAVLGTPAVYVNSLTMGYIEALEQEYGLLFGFRGEHQHRQALEQAVTLLQDDPTNDWDDRRERLLADCHDTTEVIIDELTGGTGVDPAEPNPTTVTSEWEPVSTNDD